MKSHTVPRRLLEQFAYHESRTNSKRLWQYQKGLPPWGEASPKSATRLDGHFSDPRDAAKEAELELRLKCEFEDPVNQILPLVGYRTFALDRPHIRQLTGYITMLFCRSRARRRVTIRTSGLKIGAFKSLFADEEQLIALAAKFTMDSIADHGAAARTINVEEVRYAIRKLIQTHETEAQIQHDYTAMVEQMMAFMDEGMMKGEWNLIRTNLMILSLLVMHQPLHGKERPGMNWPWA